MANFTEIKGSRRVSEDGKKLYGQTLWVATTVDDANIPDTGDEFPGDAAGITARKCVKKTADTEVVPGIFYFALDYIGFKPYA